MSYVAIYTDFDMLLYGIGIILLFITALRYLEMARKKEKPHEKLVNSAFGISCISGAILFGLFMFYFFSLEGYHMEYSYLAILELEYISLVSDWLYRVAWISYFTGQAIFIRAGEKIRNKKILL